MYVELLNCRSDRTILAKLCLSAHKLSIEKGRHANVPRRNRVWNIFYGHSLPSADSRRAVVRFWRKNVHITG